MRSGRKDLETYRRTMENDIKGSRNHHTQRKPMKNGKEGLETVIYKET